MGKDDDGPDEGTALISEVYNASSVHGVDADAPLPRWAFIPFIVLLTFDYVKDDIEVFLGYMTIAHTSYGCSFSQGWGIYLYCNAALQVLVQPLLAWLTDRYSNYSTMLMWISLFIELIAEILMFVIPGLPFWALITLQLIRSVALWYGDKRAVQ